MSGTGHNHRYHSMQQESSPATMSSFFSFAPAPAPEATRIFEELPKATIVSVSRPDAGDISPMLLTYTIQFQYKQFKWQLVKKASHLFYLHFALKKRLLFEEIHEKQEQELAMVRQLSMMMKNQMKILFPYSMKKMLETEMFHQSLL